MMEQMEQLILNGAMQITYPRDFYTMNEEEVAGYRAGEKGEGVCLKAPDRHIIISIAWKKAGGFLNGLLMGNDLVKNMESCYKKRFKPYGYALNEHLQRQVGTETADGLCYRYRAQDIDMTGESFVLKKDGTLYYFHSYYRTLYAQECRKVWSGILAGIEWV